MGTLERPRFTRTIEDFRCEVCGAHVVGDGYTDHCPACLHGKHVDVNPGDRAHACQGIMEPIEVEQRKGGMTLRFRCRRCGVEHRNRMAPADDIERAIALMRGRAGP